MGLVTFSRRRIRANQRWSGDVRFGLDMNGAGQGWSGSGLVVVGRVRPG